MARKRLSGKQRKKRYPRVDDAKKRELAAAWAALAGQQAAVKP